MHQIRANELFHASLPMQTMDPIPHDGWSLFAAQQQSTIFVLDSST
jgi:hypothetical protein